MENLSAKELRDKIAAGKVSSLDATKAVFERIGKFEPTIGAYISTYEDMALEAAADVDRRIAAGEPVGQLAGVPVAIMVRARSVEQVNRAKRVGRLLVLIEVIFGLPCAAVRVRSCEALGSRAQA